MTSPRLIKGGIVSVDPTTGATLGVIALQYNPDQLSRTLQVQGSGADSGVRSQALRLKGPAVETLKLDAEIDATDALEFPDQNPAAVDLGIHPQLAALEALVQPRADALVANDAMARRGELEVLAIQQPLTLFVWGRHRVVPVRITELSFTEDAFDAELNPIRAKVSLGMRVLTVDDLGFDHRGGTAYLTHLRSREGLASAARTAAISALGLETI